MKKIMNEAQTLVHSWVGTEPPINYKCPHANRPSVPRKKFPHGLLPRMNKDGKQLHATRGFKNSVNNRSEVQ